MSRTSCIRHPRNEVQFVVHEWQVKACDKNACAAALLSFFEAEHNQKIEWRDKAREANDVAERHGYVRSQDESLWQFHTEEQLEKGILIYKRSMIRAALLLLEEKGFLRMAKNPDPRMKFDRKHYYLFCPERVNEWIDRYIADTGSGSEHYCLVATTWQRPLEPLCGEREDPTRVMNSGATGPAVTGDAAQQFRETEAAVTRDESSSYGRRAPQLRETISGLNASR